MTGHFLLIVVQRPQNPDSPRSFFCLHLLAAIGEQTINNYSPKWRWLAVELLGSLRNQDDDAEDNVV